MDLSHGIFPTPDESDEEEGGTETEIDNDAIQDLNINVERNNAGMHPGGSERDGKLWEAPLLGQAVDALKDLKGKLHPPQQSGQGFKDPQLDPFVQMESMQTMLNFYTAPQSMSYGKWGAPACQAAVATGCGCYCVSTHKIDTTIY
jgi:hypothetical protein